MKAEKMTRKNIKALVAKTVSDCQKIVDNYIDTWKPIDSSWETLEGSAYLRLSTDAQVIVEKGSLEQQIYLAIGEAVERSRKTKKNYRITHFYIEPGITGRNDRRPQFTALRSAIEDGEFDFVVFKEIARVSREVYIWKQFFKLCHENNCEICIKGFPLDPNNPGQIFMLDILAAVAEYESNLTSKRIRENNFSAIISSGKFNSTHSFLGLDQLSIGGDYKTGLYTKNDEEIKTVEWIMEEFSKVKNHTKLLGILTERGINNKNGDTFSKNTLRNLLTNMRYIGKWEVNAKNKDANQERLASFEKYQLVDLPHGEVIDLKLWTKVQKALNQATRNKTGRKDIRRIYPLSNLLKYKDGSKFTGNSCWSSTSGERYNYYANSTNKIRVPAEILEERLILHLKELAENSPEIHEAVRQFDTECKKSVEMLDRNVADLLSEKSLQTNKREKLETRLDFLLQHQSGESAVQLSNEYVDKFSEIGSKIKDIETKVIDLRKYKKKLSSKKHDLTKVKALANECIEFATKGDYKAIKGLLPSIFTDIVINDADHLGVRELSFDLNQKDEFIQRDIKKASTPCKVEDAFCVCDEVVGIPV